MLPNKPTRLFVTHKITIILVAAFILLLLGGFFAYQRFVGRERVQYTEEIDLAFDPRGPYALIYPRRDGNALILNIKRTASYDQIKYELSYNSEGVDRGAAGDISTKEKKGEYKQEILFGSCSTGGKCVYDKGVENGTLILHIRKGDKAYRMTTQWHMQKPDIALGVLTSGDNHLVYKIDSFSADLPLIKYTITNDLSGVPKLPEGKVVFVKAYAINSPEAKELPSGVAEVELPEDPPAGSKIAVFDDGKNAWVEYDTKIEGSKLTALVQGGGAIAVLTSSSK